METIANTRPRASIREAFYCQLAEATHAIGFDGASGATVWYGVGEADAHTFGRKVGYDRVALLTDEPVIPGGPKRHAAWWVGPLALLTFVAAFWAAVIGTRFFTTPLPLGVTVAIVALATAGHVLWAVWEAARVSRRRA